MNPKIETDFTNAIARSLKVREIYNKLEALKHGSAWTNQEDVIGFVSDVGELGRMVMAAEGRWVYDGELDKELPDKLAECLWWLFVLSNRLGIDLNSAFSSKMEALESSLSASLDQAGEQPAPLDEGNLPAEMK